MARKISLAAMEHFLMLGSPSCIVTKGSWRRMTAECGMACTREMRVSDEASSCIV